LEAGKQGSKKKLIGWEAIKPEGYEVSRSGSYDVGKLESKKTSMKKPEISLNEKSGFFPEQNSICLAKFFEDSL
jgi:hypothetical protein